MIKVIFIATVLLMSLNARENPFFPSNGDKVIQYTTNESKVYPPLKRATISLPPQARVLQKVTLEYKNLDGTLESKSINLENSVDWHLPVFISQNYAQKSEDEPKFQAKTQIITAPSKYSEIASFKYAKFYAKGKQLKIKTSDKMIRKFLLVNPHRIVIDFQKENDFKSYFKQNSGNYFKTIRAGSHKGYYRVVVELDGYYKYKVDKISEGYLCTIW